MRNLFQFILKHSNWLIAVILIAFSFYLIFTQNSYHRSVYITSANKLTGWYYDVSNKASAFLYLNSSNKILLERTAELEQELVALKQYISDINNDTLKSEAFRDSINLVEQFTFIPAEVVNVSFSGPNNFLTVNKGSLHGVKPDMGVVSQTGITGVVLAVSDKFSVIIPLINPKFRLSAKLKGSENTGSITWDGKNLGIAQIGELPKHEIYNVGDTVLTSFSRIFPKDIVIGFITEEIPSKDDNFKTLNMRIATDFHALRNVLIINDGYFEEKNMLENSIN